MLKDQDFTNSAKAKLDLTMQLALASLASQVFTSN